MKPSFLCLVLKNILVYNLIKDTYIVLHTKILESQSKFVMIPDEHLARRPVYQHNFVNTAKSFAFPPPIDAHCSLFHISFLDWHQDLALCMM